MSPSAPPLRLSREPGEAFRVAVTRGALVESVHRVRAAVVRADGLVLAAWGDVLAPVFPRSAVKAIQALPLLTTGAADAAGLGPQDLALACASHRGEGRHTARVGAWLQGLGLGPDHLACGCHPPYHAPTWEAMLARGEPLTPLHNNCSGKHAGFLTTALHRGEPLAGYEGRDHPVQGRATAALATLTGVDLAGASAGVDGCAIPAFALPLAAIALGMARLADPSGLPSEMAAAAARLTAAWASHPEMVAGEGHLDTVATAHAGGRVLLKSGAEGVCCAVVPGDGLGVAVKVEDGAARADGPVMLAVLATLGILSQAELDGPLAAHARPVLTNRRGDTVGHLKVEPLTP